MIKALIERQIQQGELISELVRERDDRGRMANPGNTVAAEQNPEIVANLIRSRP